MMPATFRENRYVIISPVKDEEKYIETTLNAVARQTVRPLRWIIVDDGSRDKTGAIISEYSQNLPWITVLRLVRDTRRQPGSAVIRAFMAGYRLVPHGEFDFVVKLDADLDLPHNYFEQLIGEFQKDQELGIASGVYLESDRGNWIAVKMPDYHAAGASKMVRAKCFTDIGGFVQARGWDTVDEIRAQMKGWRTRHFGGVKFYHLKNEGSGLGSLRTNQMHGEIYYRTGGGGLFFLFKFLHRLLFGRPFLCGGLVMLCGFLRPWMSRKQRLVTEGEARFYRKMLDQRISKRLEQVLERARLKSETWGLN